MVRGYASGWDGSWGCSWGVGCVGQDIVWADVIMGWMRWYLRI